MRLALSSAEKETGGWGEEGSAHHTHTGGGQRNTAVLVYTVVTAVAQLTGRPHSTHLIIHGGSAAAAGKRVCMYMRYTPPRSPAPRGVHGRFYNPKISTGVPVYSDSPSAYPSFTFCSSWRPTVCVLHVPYTAVSSRRYLDATHALPVRYCTVVRDFYRLPIVHAL